jgi:hypothetical protein
MFGTAGPSHEWDTFAFALSTIPVIATLILAAGAVWEQWSRRPNAALRRWASRH